LSLILSQYWRHLLPPKKLMSPEQPALHATEIPLFPIAALDRDAHRIYREQRSLTPLIRREGGSYIAIRAPDVERLATDPQTRQMETDLLKSRGIASGPLFNAIENSMLYSNGPEHRRRRSPMSRAFAFKLMSALRPQIRALAHSLIDRHFARGEMNFLDDFASLLPAHLISAILGLPESDIPHFTGWVYRMSRAISFSFANADIPDIEAAAQQLASYAQGLLAARRAAPRDDFLTSYVEAVDQEGLLSPAETLAQLITTILAGSDTTRGAMAVQVSLLLQHHEQWDAVRADNELIPRAVSEALRYEPVAASIPRFTLEDIDLDGHVVPANSILTLSTMAAMRDPARYNEPDSFDICRTDLPTRHLVFGAGAHRCLGETLARAELEEGLAAILERLPHLRLVGDPPAIQGHGGIRRVGPMVVSWPRTGRA
jgi:cytochrome P450